MKYFLFADPHGNFTALKEALDNAGYDETNDNHTLVGLGDYFDRGSENDKMADFIIDQYEKGKAIYILGNHDQMLLDVLTFKDNGIFNCLYNGLNRTINQLSKVDWSSLKYDQEFVVNEINKNYPKLLEILKQMKDILEIKNFVITHGGYSNRLKDPYLTDMWYINNWAHTEFFVEWFATSDDFKLVKTYIFGHWHAYRLRNKFIGDTDEIPTPEPFIHRNFIGLDACTTATNKVNIYIIDDELV